MSLILLSIQDHKTKADHFLALGDLSSALEIYISGLIIHPESLELNLCAGFVKGQLNLMPGALEHFRQASQLDPNSLDAYRGLALCAENLNDWTLALQANKKTIDLISRDLRNSNLDDLRNILSIFKKTIDIYCTLNLEDQALDFIDDTLVLFPCEGLIYTYKGLISDQKRATDPCDKCSLRRSIECYERAISIDPSRAENHYFLANLLSTLKQWQKAVNTFNVALQLRPNHIESHNNIAVAYQALDDGERASYHFKRCIEFLEVLSIEATNPKLCAPQLFFNAGAALVLQFKDEEARAYFERALLLDPRYPQLLGAYVHLRMKLCDWYTRTKIAYPSKTQFSRFDLNELIRILLKWVQKKEILVHPFTLLSITDNAPIHLQASITWANSIVKEVSFFKKEFNQHASQLGVLKVNQGMVEAGVCEIQTNSQLKQRKAKIRIGYFSSDFKEHATAYLIASLFELHNREDFEVLAYSWSVNDESLIRSRLQASFDYWYEVQNLTDIELAQLARSHNLAIAVDLKGYTQGARTSIFALRVAPIQLSYLGYPGSLGADFMDYCVVDHVVVPPEHSSFMHEKLIFLPPSYQVNDYKQLAKPRLTAKTEHGLPLEGAVLCALNSSYKITPDMFSIWVSILLEQEQAIIWLLEDTDSVVNNLREFSLQRGVNPKRLVFAKRVSHDLHLERLKHADLFLDTFPCNAHTSASDALGSGLPLVTMCGGSFASRVAASLLASLGLNELVTYSLQGYKNKVLELLKEPERLSLIKAQLLTRKESSSMPLFDTHRFILHYEKCLNSIVGVESAQ